MTFKYLKDAEDAFVELEKRVAALEGNAPKQPAPNPEKPPEKPEGK